EAVGADEVVLWKTVAGFMTADPDVVPEARRIPVLGRSEAVELAVHGAGVLHAGALEPAERGGGTGGVPPAARADAAGRPSEAATPSAGPLALAHREELALLREALFLGRDQGVQLAELHAALAQHGLEPYRASFTGREAALLVPDDERAADFAARRGSRARL